MLPRPNRLRRHHDFREVYAHGRRWPDPLLVLHVLSRPGEGKRMGISASRRLGGAVVRNRARRRLRTILRSWEPGIRAGCDLVVSLREPAAGADYPALHAAVGRLLSRAGILTGPVAAEAPAQRLPDADVEREGIVAKDSLQAETTE